MHTTNKLALYNELCYDMQRGGGTVLSCFFIGHRGAPEALRPLLDAAVERHIIEYGVTEFVVGHYGRFDYMAAGAVRKAIGTPRQSRGFFIDG